MRDAADVVVVGAGPVGLLAAVELALGGVGVVALERLAAPSLVSKALGIGPLGAEALARRGLMAGLDAAEARRFEAMGRPGGPGGQGPGSGPGPKFGGHFGGLKLIRVDAQREPARRPRLVDQQAIEAMLLDRASALGVEVWREAEVTGFAESADGVDVDWASPAGDRRIRCSYLVGADGGRSAVRKLAGFAFPGHPPTSTLYQASVEVDHPDRLLPSDWHWTPTGVFNYGFLPGRLFLLDFSGPPADRQAPVTLDEIEAVLRRISGADVRVTALHAGSRWADNTRLADSYRRGRIFLAGDAAHVHSPFGGQGMSLGLLDAANLGWKLAAVIRGDLPEGLLDTYNAERRPVAEAVLANTLAQAAIMRPDPRSAAIREVVAQLMRFDDANRYFGEMMTGLSARYDLGSDRDEVGRTAGDRPVVGDPDAGTLFDLMRGGLGALLDASAGGEASAVVAAHAPDIRRAAVAEGPSMLIRPDACIAWAGEPGSTEGLEQALRRWFPRSRPATPDPVARAMAEASA